MTTQSALGLKSDAITDEEVAQHLQLHPDFFERHSGVLTKLRLPHQRNSAQTVSLVERQVEVLRERNQSIERKLKELVDVARGNDALADKIHHFARRLIRARTLANTIEAVDASLREDFEAMNSVLVLFLPEVDDLKVIEGQFLRLVARDSSEMKTFDTFITAGKPRCGQIRDAQRDWLFGPNNIAIGSVALAPIGVNCRMGFLAIGSSDSERFHPTMSTDYLARIGDHTNAALERFG
jgi:uncharacterized protein YigA (DUF484 family)